jgi:hypothetical protein
MAQGYVPSPEERRLLLEMAKQDVRSPYDQLRYLIVSEATKRGLLSSPTNSDASGLVLAGAPTGINR